MATADELAVTKHINWLLYDSHSTREDYNILNNVHFLEEHFLPPEIRPSILHKPGHESRLEERRRRRGEKLMQNRTRTGYNIVTGELRGDKDGSIAQNEKERMQSKALAKKREQETSRIHPVLQVYLDPDVDHNLKRNEAHATTKVIQDTVTRLPQSYKVREACEYDLLNGETKDDFLANDRLRRRKLFLEQHSLALRMQETQRKGAVRKEDLTLEKANNRLKEHFNHEFRDEDILSGFDRLRTQIKLVPDPDDPQHWQWKSTPARLLKLPVASRSLDSSPIRSRSASFRRHAQEKQHYEEKIYVQERPCGIRNVAKAVFEGKVDPGISLPPPPPRKSQLQRLLPSTKVVRTSAFQPFAQTTPASA